MKKVNKFSIPDELESYSNQNPKATWNEFKDECQDGYKIVQEHIKQDQGGLCCYCEIDFHDPRGIRDDFRIEHFHPKSDETTNWHLVWNNLFGCCLGGSQKHMHGERFIVDKRHRHSDVLKGDNNWDDEILNPLDIPAFPLIWEVSANGEMSVNVSNCKASDTDIIKAKNCLDEKKLNLNSPYLLDWRKAVIEQLREELKSLVQNSSDDEMKSAIDSIIKAQLSRNSKGNFPKFFTTIRSYFKQDAEIYLQEVGYDG
jgi:uncharacterized protein (TIGR02646 family)